MMNQMLSKCLSSSKVSKERLDEIFAVPKTAILWQQIVEHEKYKKWFEQLNRQIEEDRGSFIPDRIIEKCKLFFEETTKYNIVDIAMVICAQQGCSFNKAVQEAEKLILSDLNNRTSEEIEEVVKAVSKNPLIKLLKHIER